ncbi:MFS transporter [Streptomyces sp. SID10853]|uniref:MFS transporter n=1 Tax=Streptomyces sp. SID10853 TaxID=2706028 RepID=UPI0013C0636E|nr:MFS transporter [Streptomyces sp. SID10853]NDZ83248.1 MFS transporter [Streptomyces sp. SID10853]
MGSLPEATAPPAGPTPPPAASRRRLPVTVWVLVCVVFVSSLCAGAIAPVLTERTSELASTTAVSGVVSAFFLARLLFTPVAGRLVSGGLARRVLPAGLLLTAACTGSVGLTHSYWQLLGLRVLGGVGSATFTVSAVALLVASAPAALRGRAFGVWSVGFESGTVIGPMAGAGLVTLAPSAPFTVAGVCLALTAVAALLLPAAVPTDTGRAAADATGGGTRTVRLRDMLAAPAYRAALLSNFAVGWGAYGIQVSLVPLFVTAHFTRGAPLSSLALTLFAVGGVVVLPIAGRLTDGWGRRPVVLLGLTLFGVGLAGIGLSTAPVPLLAAALLTGAGCGIVGPAHGAAVADIVGPDSSGGSALAGFQVTADVGAVAGPLLAGLTAQELSFPAAFLLTAAIPALALLAWLRAPETRPLQAPAT